MSNDLHHWDTMKLRLETRCVTVPQGRPIPVREMSGTRRHEHHRYKMNLRERLFRAASGPPGILPLGSKACRLGTSHPGTAGSGEARFWRGNVVKSGALTILNNMAQSSRVIYLTELKERHCQNFAAPWVAERWVHMRPELVVWETLGGCRC